MPRITREYPAFLGLFPQIKVSRKTPALQIKFLQNPAFDGKLLILNMIVYHVRVRRSFANLGSRLAEGGCIGIVCNGFYSFARTSSADFSLFIIF